MREIVGQVVGRLEGALVGNTVGVQLEKATSMLSRKLISSSVTQNAVNSIWT